ncbi:hypothetical protein VFA_001579 [Vibrio furnissii CIP 102972]|nr:hypothetical protein VFA_001579 [Vibrio furnissii CIP 102972]
MMIDKSIRHVSKAIHPASAEAELRRTDAVGSSQFIEK